MAILKYKQNDIEHLVLPGGGQNVSYAEQQNLTSSQKTTARNNIDAGTVTSVAIKMNTTTKGTITTSGTIDLGTVITDVSSKEDISNKVTSVSSSSTNTQYPTAKCLYDLVGNVESLLEALL